MIQHYVEMRKVGAGRGQVTAYPRQLESLIRLSEAHARMRFSNLVEVGDVEEAARLHREALKQSATDPTTGRVDVTILTTGQSSAGRRRRQEVATALRTIIKKKSKTASINIDALLKEFRTGSELQITRDMFEDALRDLQEEQTILRNRNNVRLLTPAAGGD